MSNDFVKRLYVPNSEEWKKELSKQRFFNNQLEVKIVENGIILPARQENGIWYGGVCESDFTFVAGYHRKKGGGGWSFNRIDSAYTVDRNEIVQFDEDVIYGGFLMKHFGHFMIECLNRLWYVIQHPELKLKIMFITTKGYFKYFEDFLKLMGLDSERFVYVDKPIQCRSIIVPEQAQYSRERITKEFLVPYQAIKSRVTPGTMEKIYLTRSARESKKHNGVHCFNEKYFEDFFVAHGFKTIEMENLSMEEQVSLIMGADEIAANLGTLTHWAIFCKPTAKFIMLTRTNKFMLPSRVQTAQSMINLMFNTNYVIVDTSNNFLYADAANGVCMLGSNKFWKEFVADYFGEYISEDDDKLYFADSLEKYLNFWCGKYVKPDISSDDVLITSLKDMCNRILTLEKVINVGVERPLLRYQTHVAKKGWGSWTVENQFSNPLDTKLDIQAIKIEFMKPFHEVYYSVYFNEKEGWSEEVSTSQMAGTTGKAKAIRGIKIRLDEAGARKFNILYRLHTFDGKWTSWAKNGEEITSMSVEGGGRNWTRCKLYCKLWTILL